MIESSLIVKCNKKAKDFDVLHMVKSNRKIIPELEQRAKLVWKDLLTEYTEKGLKVWDGIYYRLENLNEVRNGSDTLKLGTIKFSTHRAYKVISTDTELFEDMY